MTIETYDKLFKKIKDHRELHDKPTNIRNIHLDISAKYGVKMEALADLSKRSAALYRKNLNRHRTLDNNLSDLFECTQRQRNILKIIHSYNQGSINEAELEDRLTKLLTGKRYLPKRKKR